jgi:monoamine oxidase
MAAFELAKNGRKALILEARDRIGGRAHTVYPESETRLELGAEFVHGNLPITLSLLQVAGLTYTATGGKWIDVKGGESEEREDDSDWSMLMRKLKALKDDMSLQDFLQLHFPETRYASLKDRAISFAEGYDSADASRASAKALFKEWSAEQETQYRIDKGYLALMNFLAEQCKAAGCHILLSHPVVDISYDESGVSITAGGKVFRAGNVVVALPLGVLQSEEAVRFSPNASEHMHAITQLGFGDVIKFIFRFRKAFWEETFPGLGFLFSGGAIPTWWTQAPADSAVLTGWMAGRAARASSQIGDKQLMSTALRALAQIFSLDIADLEGLLIEGRVANWSAEPYTLGAYAYATVGSDNARKILSNPIDGRIFFAGEYLYDGPAMGTVEAALWSGREVSRRLLS